MNSGLPTLVIHETKLSIFNPHTGKTDPSSSIILFEKTRLAMCYYFFYLFYKILLLFYTIDMKILNLINKCKYLSYVY